jgi:Leucine carboxyl methyltransferase
MESMRSEPKTCAASKQPEGRFQGSHMAGIESVTGTAFIVAEWRAEENAETRPLYRDPIVPLFLTEETNKAAEHIAAGFPPIKKVVKIRTRYFDDRLDQQLQLGCRQVVILGAGLDTRSIRKQAPGVVYFEIDDGNTLSFKKSRLEGHGFPHLRSIFLMHSRISCTVTRGTTLTTLSYLRQLEVANRIGSLVCGACIPQHEQRTSLN